MYSPYANTTFADFQALPPSPSDILRKTLEERDRKKFRDDLIKALGDVESLKSDFLDMSSFYYLRKADIIYQMDNYKICLIKPEPSVETHIRKINNL